MAKLEPEFQDADFEDVPVELESTDLGRLSQDILEDRALEDTRAYNPGLQRVILVEGATRADAIGVLSKTIPTNGYGLPTFFYRSDMLPADLGNLCQDDADVAAVYLNYDEGYPTFGDKIFWFQLPHEAFGDFLAFQRYLEQSEVHGLRQLALLSQEENVALNKLQTLRTEYYWTERARAYDLFNIAAERKRREIRSRKMENSHFEVAANLLKPLQEKFDDPKFFDSLTAKEAVEVLRLLINIQRVSSGLSQNGNAGNTPHNPDGAVTPAQLMKNIAESAGSHDQGLGLDNNLQALLSDPKFAFEAQKLVLRVRRVDLDENIGSAVTVADPTSGSSDSDKDGNVRAIQHDA